MRELAQIRENIDDVLI